MSVYDALNLIDFEPNHDQIASSGVAVGVAAPAPPAPTASWAGSGEAKPTTTTPPLATQHTSPLFHSLITRPPPSVAPSHALSLGAQQRRSETESRFTQESALRRRAFEEAEQRRWESESLGLQAKDEESRLGENVAWVGETSPVDDEAGQDLTRRIQELQLQLEDHRRASDYRHRLSQDPARLISTPAATLKFVDLGSRFKPKAPSTWTGVYDYHKLETWLASAEAWLGSIGLRPTDPIDRELTPSAFYAIRQLMSDTEPAGGISPQAWFDARNKRTPFRSTGDVFAAIRAHWVDDQAKERSFHRYRNAKQGTLTARDYATQLAALADACLTHTIPEQERILVFLAGLRESTANFVRQNLGILAIQGVTEPSFETVANIAAMTDTMPEYRAARPSRVSSASPAATPSSSRRHGTDSTRSSEPSGSTSSAGAHAAWQERAAKWQTDHPTSTKSVWFKTDAVPLNRSVRCYNCGKHGNHLSSSCTQSRVSPSVVVAAAKVSTAATAAPRPAPAPGGAEPAKAESMTVASASIMELSDEEPGKARDE